MGSRMMHAIIGHRIATELSMNKVDKTAFLVGSVIVDAAKNKDQSHYFIGDISDYSRSIDYKNFLKQNAKNPQQYLVLGMYTHLIADDLWLKGFYLPWLKNRMENDQAVFQRYHQDFRLLNGKLLDHYQVSEELQIYFQERPFSLSVQEVTEKEMQDFMFLIKDDLSDEEDVLKKDLTVFTLEQIIGYIETSVELSLQKIKDYWLRQNQH